MSKRKRVKIGLALGSGGVRGLAHIGVLKVLAENNIPIDFIAGSSIGALVGGFYAAGLTAEQIEKIALKTNWSRLFSLIDLSFKQGLIGGEKIKKFIKENISNIKFKDLKIPLTVVATDLKNGKIVYLNQGEVASAIKTSLSFPPVFNPVEQKNKLLIDGGFSMPVPVEAVKKMGADIMIAVNLDGSYFQKNQLNNKKLTLYQIARNIINIVRYHLADLNAKNADLVVCPDVGDISWNKFVNGREIISAGERVMRKKIKNLKKLLANK